MPLVILILFFVLLASMNAPPSLVEYECRLPVQVASDYLRPVVGPITTVSEYRKGSTTISVGVATTTYKLGIDKDECIRLGGEWVVKNMTIPSTPRPSS